MLKLLGACLVLLACTSAGFYFASKLSNRTNQLRELQMCLQLLETEIWYGSTPLERAFDKIQQQEKGRIGRLFQRCNSFLQELDGATTTECWERALKDTIPSLALKRTDIEWLNHFGSIIGNSDREDQKKHINLLMTHFKKLETEARDEQLRYEKMYKTLGFLSGAVIVILMM